MQTTLELDEQLLAQAMKTSGETTERGVVEAGLRLLIRKPALDDSVSVDDGIPSGFRRLGKSSMTMAEAAEAIRKIAAKHTLGGLKTKDLIEEGRH